MTAEGKNKMQRFMQKAYHLVGLVFFLLKKKKEPLNEQEKIILNFSFY